MIAQSETGLMWDGTQPTDEYTRRIAMVNPLKAASWFEIRAKDRRLEASSFP